MADLDPKPKFGDVLLLTKIRTLTKAALSTPPHSILISKEGPPGEGRALRRLLRTV